MRGFELGLVSYHAKDESQSCTTSTVDKMTSNGDAKKSHKKRQKYFPQRQKNGQEWICKMLRIRHTSVLMKNSNKWEKQTCAKKIQEGICLEDEIDCFLICQMIDLLLIYFNKLEPFIISQGKKLSARRRHSAFVTRCNGFNSKIFNLVQLIARPEINHTLATTMILDISLKPWRESYRSRTRQCQ